MAKQKSSTSGHRTQRQLAEAIMRAEKAEARADAAEARVRFLEKELFEMALTYKVPRLGSKKGC